MVCEETGVVPRVSC